MDVHPAPTASVTPISQCIDRDRNDQLSPTAAVRVHIKSVGYRFQFHDVVSLFGGDDSKYGSLLKVPDRSSKRACVLGVVRVGTTIRPIPREDARN